MLAPLQQEDCFSNIPQDFLICTTIHKARQLGVFQGEVYVRLTLDKMKRHTKTFANSENPYFNEYFVFEIKCTLSELLRLTIVYVVKKRVACKRDLTLGELLIDMQSVWNQRNRCYFKRWGRLESSIEEQQHTVPSASDLSEAKGFLQIDLAIVSQASNTNALLKPDEDDLMSLNIWQIHQDYDDIEKNLLENSNLDIKCNIRYTIIFYSAVMSKKSDYMLQFRFHPFKGKTIVAKSTQNPVWNQEITFAWTYPSLAQTFLIQLMAHEHLQWKCVVDHEIHLDEIAFKDKPTLGPCFLHMYDGVNASKYVGRLLLQIQSEYLESNPQRQIHIKSATHLDEKRYWDEETFIVEFAVLQGDFIHANVSNCKINMKLAEHTSNNLECFLKTYPTKKGGQAVVNNLKYFRQEPPYKAIMLKVQLPDNRRKYEIDLFTKGLVDYMRCELETFKQYQIQYSAQHQSQIKVLREILTLIGNKIKLAFEEGILEYKGLKEPTKCDVNRFQHMKEIFVNFSDDLKMLRSRLKPSNDIGAMERNIKEVLQDLLNFINKLENYLAHKRLQDEWPELLVFITGNKESGICRLNIKDFVYMSTVSEEASRSIQCWKVRSFIFKDIQCQHTCYNCGCTTALVLGCLSICAEKERNDFLANIKTAWINPEPFYWSPTIECTTFKCRIFIHQAKIRPGADRNGLCDPYVRVMICSNATETQILLGTLSPIWNSVITFDNLQLPGHFQWYRENPPLVAIELYDTDKNTADDYLGCALLKASVISQEWIDATDGEVGKTFSLFMSKNALQKFQLLKYLTPPPLKWVPLAYSGAIRAEILMSAELVETQADESAEVLEESNVNIGIPAVIRPNMRNYVLEVIFAGFRNYKRSSVLSGRHRVKLMMGDLMLTSGLSSTRIRHSINFLILYASGVVSLPEQLAYWPAIIATDVAVSSKGQETTLGAVLIPNSKKYLQENKQMPCIEFDEGVESEAETYITSTTLHMEHHNDSEYSPLLKRKTKVSAWSRILSSGRNKSHADTAEPLNLTDINDENEYNWWTKFYNSGTVESCGAFSQFKHKLCIYPNELEKQPEFSNFTDWAEPLQMVHGVRYKRNSLHTEQVYTTLKLNIKITPCQCDHSDDANGSMLRPLATALNPRFQSQLQSLADLVKIVVRVYIVQGLQFRPSANRAQADSYVKLQLGQKHVTNRAEYIANASNPVFGKSFELEGLLPREHILEVSVFNRSSLHDEPIGSTQIDLEDRWRSKHRGTVGIANEFSSFGYNKWRDAQTPTHILHELCLKTYIRPPKVNETTIEVDGMSLEDETEIAIGEDRQERLSLTALKNLQHLPSFRYNLVPEHVESRSLYRSDYPGIDQGKIQLWLELYDGNMNLPPAIDITPQPPQTYELRVVIIGVSDVILEEKNIFGSAMSDIYVKGWCSSPDETQNTDIHYRSLNGEGKFNWRMIFPLKYSSVEDMMIVRRKTSLLEDFHTKEPPKLSLQIWDNDILSKDDFIGTLEIHLSNFPQPFETAKKCQLTDYDSLLQSMSPQQKGIKQKAKTSTIKLLNIFRQKKVKGWFAARGNIPEKGYELGLTGKIELELELLTEKEALTYPAGLGREPPSALDDPVRPDTSFNPVTSPWRGLKQIVAPRMMKYVLIVLLLVFLGFFIFLFIMHFPLILATWGY